MSCCGLPVDYGRQPESTGRPQHKAPLTLKGGDSDGSSDLEDKFHMHFTEEFPVDAATALQIHAGVFTLAGALCIPDLNLPLLDAAFKLHETRASFFYNDLSPESETLVKAHRWVGASFFAISVMIMTQVKMCFYPFSTYASLFRTKTFVMMHCPKSLSDTHNLHAGGELHRGHHRRRQAPEDHVQVSRASFRCHLCSDDSQQPAVRRMCYRCVSYDYFMT
jgi:hypothetical protein